MTGEEAGARQANPAQDEASGEPNRSWESAEKVRKWVEWVIPRRSRIRPIDLDLHARIREAGAKG